MQMVQFAGEPPELRFRCHFRKFSGFTIHWKGIDPDSTETKAIQDMRPPTTCKQLKSSMGRESYVPRFIPALAELLEPFNKLLKKNAPFGEEQQSAFQKVKSVLSSPLTMIPPIKGLPLTLYLTSIDKSIGALWRRK